MSFDLMKRRFARYRGELISALGGVGIHALVYFVLAPNNAYKAVVAALSVVVWLQLALAFNVKRLFNKRLGVLDDILEVEFGFSLEENQYNHRSRHFRREKLKLAEHLVSTALPRTVQSITAKYPNFKSLLLFLDSGTTITPAFRPLFFHGLDVGSGKKLTIHTNNLAGIDELHKLSHVDLGQGKLREDNFNLLPGSPLSKYRATTAGSMRQFLQGIWKDEELEQQRADPKSQHTVVISVITANWLLAGHGFDCLQLCSRGRGHLEFKRMLIENSDYVIVVAPLPKVLRVDDVKRLNELIDEQDGFQAFCLPLEKRECTFLLTTLRPEKSLSPFVNITIELQNLQKDDRGKNYSLWPHCPELDPPGTPREVLALECPHEYVRRSFKDMYGMGTGL